MVSIEQVNTIIAWLEDVRSRPNVWYIDDELTLRSFITGVTRGMQAVDGYIDASSRRAIIEERGWSTSETFWIGDQMRRKKMTDEEMIDEVLTIEIESWKHYREALTKAARQTSAP